MCIRDRVCTAETAQRFLKRMCAVASDDAPSAPEVGFALWTVFTVSRAESVEPALDRGACASEVAQGP